MLYFALKVLLLPTVLSCPCNFEEATGKISCEKWTQDILPWTPPLCLNLNDLGLVKTLELSYQNFSSITNGAFSSFPNLETLDLSYDKIERIEMNAFEDNHILQSLIMSSNDLLDVPQLFSSPNNNLGSLILRRNKIKSVNSENLVHLIYLDLNDNEMTEESLKTTLIPLTTLKNLKIEANKISTINKQTFANQDSIEYISFWDNQINEISAGALDHLVNLEYLNLQGNDILGGYTTEAWHLCHKLQNEELTIDIEYNKKITKDLKVDDNVINYCAKVQRKNLKSFESSCENYNGHLDCFGDIADYVCDLINTDFKSITFRYPKDQNPVPVENFYEAETNPYFKDINGSPNQTQYLANLKLYGTSFDLSSLNKFTGERTKTVEVFADTIHMSTPIQEQIKYLVKMKARVVSISDDIPMNMTKQQFFSNLEANQPVENWALVEEIVTEVGNSSFFMKKLGFIEVQQERKLQPKAHHVEQCSPRIFTVNNYHTGPEIFFDRVQMNLERVAIRTLASTRSNDRLALDVADHILQKTADPKIVTDKKTYIVAQKLLRDKEAFRKHSRNVPFYKTSAISDLSKIMFDKMSIYSANETVIMMKLDIALGRMADMNKNFEDARLQRELYFERELATLEEIWNSTDTAWHWNFNASRDMEQSIQDSIQKNGDEMFEMKKNDLEEMLRQAVAMVESDQAVVDKLKEEIDRYSVSAKKSVEYQQVKLDETNDAGEDVGEEKDDLDDAIQEWKEEQMRKAFFGFFKALFGVIVGIATFNPALAGAEIAGAATATEGILKIAEVFENIEEIINSLKEMEEMLETMMDIDEMGNIVIPDFGGDLALDVAENWRSALENAYKMKALTSKFSDIRISGETIVDQIGPNTDGGVDPAPMKQAMFTYADRGTQLIQETINFADQMMKLADLAGDLAVAEIDLQNAIEQVGRIEEMLDQLSAEHNNYVQWMNDHRDQYQNKTNEMAEEYDQASQEAKEAFKREIMELFNRFKEEFEKSNAAYVNMMNQLTENLYIKLSTLKQHSMVQRSMILNLYQDFCDGLFYFSFSNCEEDLPSMSDDFGVILLKLNDIQWNSITAIENLPNPAEVFENVNIDIMEKRIVGSNSSWYGPITSFRETGEVNTNLHDFDSLLNTGYYRIRVDSVKVHFLDKSDPPAIYQSPQDEEIKFKINFPLEFTDYDQYNNEHKFRGTGHLCTSSYYIDADGDSQIMTSCNVADEFSDANYKTSHNGLFNIKLEAGDDILLNHDIGGIRVTLGGDFIVFTNQDESNLLLS